MPQCHSQNQEPIVSSTSQCRVYGGGGGGGDGGNGGSGGNGGLSTFNYGRGNVSCGFGCRGVVTPGTSGGMVGPVVLVVLVKDIINNLVQMVEHLVLVEEEVLLIVLVLSLWWCHIRNIRIWWFWWCRWYWWYLGTTRWYRW